MDEEFGGDWPRPTLSEAHCYGYGFLQAALRLRLRLHGVVHDMPSPMGGLGGMGAWGQDGMGANYCTHAVRLQYFGCLWVRTHYMPKHAPTCGRHLCVGVCFK